MRTVYQFISLIIICFVTGCTGCNRVLPNFEGVLMTNYGRNGMADFKPVTGSQGMLLPSSELYQVPMYEQRADPDKVEVNAVDGGVFTVDPTYTYQTIRGKGVEVIFNYRHVGAEDYNVMMENIEAQVLNPIVTNIYREEARNFTTDSLMNHLNKYELAVEQRIRNAFQAKFFAINELTSGLKPPASMGTSIEERNNVIQQAIKAKNELEISRIMLEKAEIDAKTNKAKAEGLQPEVLQAMWIEAIRTTQNKVIITDGKTPIILQP